MEKNLVRTALTIEEAETIVKALSFMVKKCEELGINGANYGNVREVVCEALLKKMLSNILEED